MTATLFTGLPRSGTTLLCALLNKLPDTVALAEPLSPQGNDVETSILQLKDFINATRESAVNSGSVVSKHLNGKIIDDFVEAGPSQVELRRTSEQTGWIAIDKDLSPGFHLFIKQPAWFTAMAMELKSQFDMFVIVRHPLAVLASWQTVDMPVHHGRMPNACRFNEEISDALDGEPDRLRRQVLIIEWALKVYSNFLPNKVVRFENLVCDPTATLANVGVGCKSLTHHFHDEALESRYPNVNFDMLQDALWQIRDTISIFYPEFSEALRR